MSLTCVSGVEATAKDVIWAPAPTTIADELAALVTSGATGMRLLSNLNKSFAKASRADVFFGIAIAVSLFEADRIGLIHDLMVSEGAVAALRTVQADG
jgi:hypothetical protein